MDQFIGGLGMPWVSGIWFHMTHDADFWCVCDLLAGGTEIWSRDLHRWSGCGGWDANSKWKKDGRGVLKNREPIQFPKLWRLRVRSKPGEALPNVKSHFPRIDAIWLPYASLEASGSTFDISPGYQISPQFPTGCSRSKIPVLSGDSNWPGR